MAGLYSDCICIVSVLLLAFVSTGESHLHCFQCRSSTLPASARRNCLDGTVDTAQCRSTDNYCVMLRYTEINPTDGGKKVVLRRECSPEFLGNYCQYRTLSDGTRSATCVSSCGEPACNNQPHTVDMDGQIDYFSRR